MPDEGVTLRGLYNMKGETVTAFIAGLDCGQFTVSDEGAIFVPFEADPQHFLTRQFLAKVTIIGLSREGGYGRLGVYSNRGIYYFPAVIGYKYASRGQRLRPIAADQTGSNNGPGFAKKRRNSQFGVLFHNAREVRVGTSFNPDRMHDIQLRWPGGREMGPIGLFSDVHREGIEDSDSYDGQIAWEASGCGPCTVLAIGGFIDTESI